MYSFKSRVRYSEVDKHKKMTLNALINYFQDCSTFHSESIGLGIEKLEQENRVWVLSSWQIVVKRFPKLFEEIEICTWPYGFKGFYGMRNFCLKDQDGNMIAWANTLWIFMDTLTGKPTRISQDQIDGYQPEEKLAMEYADRKIKLEDQAEQAEMIQILKHQIDTNDHVNNGQYVSMAEEFLPEDFVIGQMRAEYRKSARLGDMIYPYIIEKDGIFTVALCDSEKKPYAIIEFTPEKDGKDTKIC